ncbi:MAG: radical SAM protein [Myxococcales bacterium]|nr:radical SAM protein [Myxococcales bacterium]
MSRSLTALTRSRLRVALVIPCAEGDPGFFPDGLLEHACARLQRDGHEARLLRVYYEGNRTADAEVQKRVEAWLEGFQPNLVVVERLFDQAPFANFRARSPNTKVALVSWGDAELAQSVDYTIGTTPGQVRRGTTRRSPSAGELAWAVEQLANSLASGDDARQIPGVSQKVGQQTLMGPPATPRPLMTPFEAEVNGECIASGAVPRLTRKYLFGNAGCPYSRAPSEEAFYEGLELPSDDTLSVLGCAFCRAGGDYQKQPEAVLLDSLVEQAAFYAKHVPELEELVLVDQYPIRYLPKLLRVASSANIPQLRWLFQARADGFTRDIEHIRAAIQVATDLGHQLEVYLTGFESFSDAELRRYNKGVMSHELVRAVENMRSLAAEYPNNFAYARAKGHSMILWSPWTSAADIRDNVDTVKRSGLLELFDEIGRNRLRLYPDLPIYYAARRDGLVLDDWEQDDEGAGRLKGYGVEAAWRFADPNIKTAYRLAKELRERLGRETEIDQLASIADAVSGGEGLDAERILRAIGDLERSVSALLGPRDQSQPASSGNQRCATVLLSGPCNNGCLTCPNQATLHSSPPAASVARARESGLPVLLAGREPTLSDQLSSLVRQARGEDHRGVGMVTNGRRFASEAFTKELRNAGLTGASVKLFGYTADMNDAITRDPGSWHQALRGVRNLLKHNIPVEIRAEAHQQNLEHFEYFAALATKLGVRALRVSISLEAVSLLRIAEFNVALARLARACRVGGVSLDVSPLPWGNQPGDRIAEIPTNST